MKGGWRREDISACSDASVCPGCLNVPLVPERLAVMDINSEKHYSTFMNQFTGGCSCQPKTVCLLVPPAL